MKKSKSILIVFLLALTLSLSACTGSPGDTASPSPAAETSEAATVAPSATEAPSEATSASTIGIVDIPAFTNEPYVTINNNVPEFSASDLSTTAFESYSNLDRLGRCGVAYANVCKETMPTEERGEIGSVKPTGWQIAKYDFVDGRYLYNRCHLIGFQLTGENANPKNLITGTRYMNVTGMLPFENMVADYVKETGNHVLYRVTPIFTGKNLVANGVQMEAESVEDAGKGILFNVFCYNNQPGVTIDYATGNNSKDSSGGGTDAGAAVTTANNASGTDSQTKEYILNN